MDIDFKQITRDYVEKIIDNIINKNDPIIAFLIPPSTPSGIPLGFSVKNFIFIPEIPLKNTKENIKKIVLITIKIDIYAKSLINLSLNLIINSTLSINNK